MSLSRYAKKRDTAEAAIVKALRDAGCKVWQQDRPFDLAVAWGGRLVLLEVKSGRSKPTAKQADELAACHRLGIPAYLVRTVDEALEAIGVQR